MESACQNNDIEKAFIGYVYHRNVSIIYVPCAKCITTAISGEASTGIQYIMMLKNPSHIDIAINLTRSRSHIPPNNLQHFLSAFNIYCFLHFEYFLIGNTTKRSGMQIQSLLCQVQHYRTHFFSLANLIVWNFIYSTPFHHEAEVFHEWLTNQIQEKFKMK